MGVYFKKQLVTGFFHHVTKIGFAAFRFVLIVLVVSACKVDIPEQPPSPYDPKSLEFEYMTDERWVSSENFQVTINTQDYQRTVLTSGYEDYKPSWSKKGDKITFFRLLEGGPSTRVWKTALCVINTDGTGFKALSDGAYADFNMTWTRDGSNLIIFNRYINERNGLNRIYFIDPEGSAGDEQLVSDISQDFEWAFCGLKDGRLFIDSFTSPDYKSFLLTPDPGKVGTYEEISRPTTYVWHKLSVSPSETKVCYMLDMKKTSSESYIDSVLYYADFDINTVEVSNPVQITKLSMKYVDEYPRWSNDETIIVYDSNRNGVNQLYGYRLSDGVTRRISPDESTNYYFGNFEKTPK